MAPHLVRLSPVIMDTTAPIVVTSKAERDSALKELIIAWAHDATTGEARYILELGPERRGAKCGCICPSCAQPLIGVNVAKTTFRQRPHFRHRKGVAKWDCAIVAARAALLRGLQQQGYIDLPARSFGFSDIGLSGHDYQAWATRPAERVSISDMYFADRVRAVLTLASGRQLEVLLTGSLDGGESAHPLEPGRALILLQVDDPEVSLMDPQDIRRHLTLRPDVICWNSHWDDAQLQLEAKSGVQSQIQEHLDSLPMDLVLPPDMPPELKRETVLHYLVKELLLEAGEVWTPAMELHPQVRASDGSWVTRKWSLPVERHVLSNVVLERRLGMLRPDLMCESHVVRGLGLSPFLIEVAVSSHVRGERLQKIRGQKLACLEIDISRFGGRVTREQLKELVVRECTTKTWIYHPLVAEASERLGAEIERDLQRIVELEKEAGAIAGAKSTPVTSIGQAYMRSVEALLQLQTVHWKAYGAEQASDEALRQAKECVLRQARLLTECGVPGGDGIELYMWDGLLARLLSLKTNTGVGVRQDDGFHVLNAAMSFDGITKPVAPLLLAAAKAFKTPMTQEQHFQCKDWRQKIANALGSTGASYQRDTKFDRLLGLVFPELVEALFNTSPRGLAMFAARRGSPEYRQP